MMVLFIIQSWKTQFTALPRPTMSSQNGCQMSESQCHVPIDARRHFHCVIKLQRRTSNFGNSFGYILGCPADLSVTRKPLDVTRALKNCNGNAVDTFRAQSIIVSSCWKHVANINWAEWSISSFCCPLVAVDNRRNWWVRAWSTQPTRIALWKHEFQLNQRHAMMTLTSPTKFNR